MATSFISVAQAASNLSQEIGTRSFDTVREQAAKANVLLLENHGVLVFGDSLGGAVRANVTVEEAAEICLYAYGLGGPKEERFLAGAPGDDGAPNLTPARMKKWSDGELKDFLGSGMTPDGDVTGETMGEVIRNTTSQLSKADLDALVAYLRSLPPLPDEPK